MQNIVIVDYGMGNISSVMKQLQRLKIDVSVSSDPAVISKADKLILPGVGHFKKAMENLSQRNIIEALNATVLEQQTPVLGICLGMQLMANSSEEGNVPGLGWIDGEAIRMKVTDSLRYKIPHVGWNTIVQEKQSALNANIAEDASMYFVHAYKFVAADSSNVLHSSIYESEFTSAVSKNNVFGVQYHPEKSQDQGLQLFKNFIAI